MSNQILISSGAKLRDLDDVIIGTDGVLTSVGFDVPYGVPRLDSNGKILVSELPNSVMEFKGVWNAATNTPTLTDGVGNAGDVYLCNVAGTVNFGTGPIVFAVGDYAVYTGTVWARSSGATGTVTSVAVSKDGDALAITGSPITTSGTINIGFTGNNLQYINGAGNLVTFPTLTGYVPYTGATSDVDLGTYGLKGDYIGFNTTPSSVPTTLGTLSWDAFYRTLQLITGDGDTTLQIGQEQVTLVHNNTGSTLVDGQVVYVTGSTGELPSVALASNTSEATSSVTFGVVTESIANGADGFITTSGIVHGLNTLAFNEGDAIWLGSTAGTFTNVKPIAPLNSVLIGYVIKKAGGNGSIFVKIQNGYELEELHDVKITSVADGDIIQWNSATSLWENVAGTTTNIAEGSNLYFTDARARGAISLTTTGSTGAATYNPSTGVLNIPNYVDQYVGTVTSVGLSAPTGFSVTGSPVTSSGTLALSFASGYSLPTNVKQSNWDDAYTWVAAFPTQTGNAGKFLTTDGSSLSWATVIAGVQSVTASSPLFSSGGANPNITIQVATTSQNGYLSSTDWNTFNGKQAGSTNLTSLSGLTYASTSFVKMTAAGTFSLDTNTYALASALGNYLPLTGGTLTGPLEISYAGVGLKLRYNATTYTDYRSDFINQNSTGPNAWQFQFNGTPLFQITSNGNTQIGTTTDAGYKLDVVGSGRFSSNLAIGAGTQSINGDAELTLRDGLGFVGLDFKSARTSGNIGGIRFFNTSSDSDPVSQILVETDGKFVFYNGTLGSVQRLNISSTSPDTYTEFITSPADADVFLGFTNTGDGNNAWGVGRRNNGEFWITNFTGNFNSGTRTTVLSLDSNGSATFSSSVTAKSSVLNFNATSGTPATTNSLWMTESSSSAIWQIYIGGSTNSFAGGLGFLQNGSAKMVLNTSGNLLIGTTTGVSGGGALQVNGNVNINGVFQINGVTIGGGGGSGVTGAGTTNYIPKWSGSTSLGNSSMYDNGGNIGIGTTTTSGKLHVLAGLTEVFAESTTAGNNAAFNVKTTARRWGIGANMALSSSWFEIYDYTAGANRFTISNVGNFLINTTTDNGYKINLNGSISFAYGYTSVFRGSSGANDILVGNTGSTFYVGGSVTATGGFFDTSDKRLKTLITDNYQAKGIETITPKLYIKNGKEELGYYAQDLQEILPSAVSENSDGFLTLSYSQVHTAKIAQLESKIAQLEELIKKLL